MQKSLTKEEYGTFFDEVSIAKYTYLIKHYFGGDVNAFYQAPSKFKEWSAEKSFNKRNALYDPAWSGIRKYNLAGLEYKWLYRIFGKNYHNAQFMHGMWDMIENTLHYRRVRHGTLPCKGRKDPYPTKYLPPRERLIEIFNNPKLVKQILDTSNYCNKVKKILDAMITEYKEKKDKKAACRQNNKQAEEKRSSASCYFVSAADFLDKFEGLLKTGSIGQLKSFREILNPILGQKGYGKIKKFWDEQVSPSVKIRVDGSLYISDEDKATIFRNQLEFVKRIREQLDGKESLKMFKNEWLGQDENGNHLWKPIEETRITEARHEVEKLIRTIETSFAKLSEKQFLDNVAD